jgi:hypothetical protein
MSTHAAPIAEKSNSPDYGLLLQQLEKRLLTASESTEAVQVLARESIWQALPDEQARQWARLAQIAGMPDLALRVLAKITERNPDCVQAWQDRVELLETLGRKEGPSLTPMSTSGAPEDGSFQVKGIEPGAPAPPQDGPCVAQDDPAPWEEGIATPFSAMRTREEVLERFLALFSGREDCFARQWADRGAGTQGYVPVRRPMSTTDVLDHISGRKTYGIYLLRHDSTVKTAVIDADLVSRLRSGKVTPQDRDLVNREKRYLLTRIPELSREKGLPCLVEFSGGKGFHFWYLFAGPVPAPQARSALQAIARRVAPDFTCFNLEVFPKQDQLAGKGFGNLVKLPLGIHRFSGRPSHFLHVADHSPWVQLEALRKVGLLPGDALSKASDTAERGELIVHPKLEQWARDYPELAVLGDRCTAIGQIMADCRQSRTLSLREEKILYGTIGFLPRARTLLHHLFQELPEYNPHLVDYRLSRLRGTPLGCKRIHSLLNLVLDRCPLPPGAAYEHPLLHWPDWSEKPAEARSERAINLRDALAGLQEAIGIVERFLEPDPAGNNGSMEKVSQLLPMDGRGQCC